MCSIFSNLRPNTRNDREKDVEKSSTKIMQYQATRSTVLYCTDTSHQMTIYRITELSLYEKIVKPCLWSKTSMSTPQTRPTTGARTIPITLNCALRLLCSVICKLKPKC